MRPQLNHTIIALVFIWLARGEGRANVVRQYNDNNDVILRGGLTMILGIAGTLMRQIFEKWTES